MFCNNNFKLVSDFLSHLKTNDFRRQEDYYGGLVSVQKSPILYNASMLLASGPDHIQCEILREYCKMTTFSANEFYSTCQHLQTKSPMSSAAFIQINHKVKGRKLKSHMFPCSLCHGKHRKRECTQPRKPKRPT